MRAILIIFSLFITNTPLSNFLCDGEILSSKIINNENGIYTLITDLDQIDAGAFVILDWKKDLMLPRTFIANEKSFSDNKWKWIYEGKDSVRLIEKLSKEEIIEHKCIASSENN